MIYLVGDVTLANRVMGMMQRSEGCLIERYYPPLENMLEFGVLGNRDPEFRVAYVPGVECEG